MSQSLWRDDTSADVLSQERKLVSVCACIGWAVHGVVFVFDNQERAGVLLSNASRTMPLDDMTIISRSQCHWMHIKSPGDFIINVSGNQLANGAPNYLCHSLELHFASGQTMSFASAFLPWRGERFSYQVRQPFLVNKLQFVLGAGCVGYDGLQTSVHLPLERELAMLLPTECKRQILLLLLIAQRSDSERYALGKKGIGKDIWWSILSHLNGYDLLEETSS